MEVRSEDRFILLEVIYACNLQMNCVVNRFFQFGVDICSLISSFE